MLRCLLQNGVIFTKTLHTSSLQHLIQHKCYVDICYTEFLGGWWPGENFVHVQYRYEVFIFWIFLLWDVWICKCWAHRCGGRLCVPPHLQRGHHSREENLQRNDRDFNVTLRCWTSSPLASTFAYFHSGMQRSLTCSFVCWPQMHLHWSVHPVASKWASPPCQNLDLICGLPGGFCLWEQLASLQLWNRECSKCLFSVYSTSGNALGLWWT